METMNEIRYGGEAITTLTEESRQQARAAQTMAGLERVGVVVKPDAAYVTTQTTPPIIVGTTRGLIAGIALALLAGLGSAVAVLVADGTDRAAILAGLAVGITNLIGVVSSYAAYGAADQQSTTEKV